MAFVRHTTSPRSRPNDTLYKSSHEKSNNLPIDVTAVINIHLACNFLCANLHVCVAVLIISSAAENTCLDLQNGIPNWESCDPANKPATANEHPLTASPDFFKCSSLLIHLSTMGVA